MDDFNFPKQYTIPTLDEIISPNTYLTDCGPYNRGSFVQFLSNSHCMENLEFVVELDRFLANMAQLSSDLLCDDMIRQNNRLLHQWSVIYKVFLKEDAIKEINISFKTRSDLCGEVLPNQKQLMNIRGLICELLLDSFNEFISYTREVTKDRTTRRRRLEIVPPEFKTLPVFHAEEIPRVLYEHVPRSLASNSLSEQQKSELSAQWDRALEQFEQNMVQVNSGSDLSLELPRSRTALAGTISTRTSSRGSSIGSIVDNLKDYSGWKTVKKLRFRRSSNEQDVQ
ncbi:CIC11C00000003136 [Sungouiella intermedia]|uniref:CIC11C00000003136 n=1 Tax=Sungouiella intermedia TaxID=45354 RepID=A0A1L0BWN0_9ASCO|nr:CIC11C00000003136 [[Candida] intermedia]